MRQRRFAGLRDETRARGNGESGRDEGAPGVRAEGRSVETRRVPVRRVVEPEPAPIERRASPEAPRHLPAPYRAEPEDKLSAVVRDAVDQVTEIARDALTIARLEAARVARSDMPKVAFAMGGVVLCTVGFILAVIALFIGLRALIPSVAWRLFLFAMLFLLLGGAAFAGASAWRRRASAGAAGFPEEEEEG